MNESRDRDPVIENIIRSVRDECSLTDPLWVFSYYLRPQGVLLVLTGPKGQVDDFLSFKIVSDHREYVRLGVASLILKGIRTWA